MNLKEKVIIIAVLFRDTIFFGFKVYNITRGYFHSIFLEDLWRFNIWGLEESSLRYLNKYKVLKENPKMTLKFNTFQYHCSKDLEGYWDLPQIDVYRGYTSNVGNKVIAYFRRKDEKRVYTVVGIDYIQKDMVESDVKDLRRGKIRICNIKDDSMRISPLNQKFIELPPIENEMIVPNKDILISKYLKSTEEKINNSLDFKVIEYRKEITRKVDLFLKDSLYGHKNIVEKKVICNSLLSATDVIMRDLQVLNFPNLKNKQDIVNVTYFIDTADVEIDESNFDNIINDIEAPPCGDIKCAEKLENIKNSNNKIDAVIKSGLNFQGKDCSYCYTMIYLYVIAKFVRVGAAGVNLDLFNDRVFINLKDFQVFKFTTFKTMIHEYMHYLSKQVNNVSGINSIKYKRGYTILNEGVTEILACFFTEKILKKQNITGIPITYYDYRKQGQNKIDISEYNIKINPFIEDLYTLRTIDLVKVGKEKEQRVSCSYRFNCYLVYKIMTDIGLYNIVECYFKGNNAKLNRLCENKYGTLKWKDFLSYLDGLNLQDIHNITQNDYKNALKILSN